MIKEVVRFKLRLGAATDEFRSLYGEVRTSMVELGVNPGIAWFTAAGQRELIVEREFNSLADYERDDRDFHAGADFMALWRRMEALAESMDVELWQTSSSREELAQLR
jgi:hypothetical protein